MLRLAMMYDYPFRVMGGQLLTHRSYGIYVDALAAQFERVLVVAPCAKVADPALAYTLRADNVDFAPLPFYNRWIRSLPAILATPVAVLRRHAQWDVLYIRLPCPLVMPAFALARLAARPLCVHVVGDLLTQMADYPGALQPLARLAAQVSELLTTRVARSALTVTQGTALAARYSGGACSAHSVIESTVGDADVRPRRHAPLHTPVRLLSVGALLPKKGVQFLLEAMATLQADLPIALSVVGSGPTAAALQQQAHGLAVDDAVHFVGPIAEDDALRDAYRAADVFVLPSLAEGVPRVLIEAMANGLPIVSTSVGGIRDIVVHERNGILVEPGSPVALADAIRRVIADASLRAHLIAGSLDTARHYTREAHARTVTNLVDAYVRERFPRLASAADQRSPASRPAGLLATARGSKS
jgi:glycosyltransferase involved in cell wall biosynthesis